MTEVQHPIAEDEVNALVALALEPEAGEPFTIGGREFRRQFLTMRGERLTHEAMTRAASRAGGSDSTSDTMAVAGTILADQDPASDVAWLATVREPGIIETLNGVVIAQMAMHARGVAAQRFIHDRRPKSTRRTVETPASAAESGLISWAWEKIGQPPAEIRRCYSSMALLALNDAEFWANYMPDEPGRPVAQDVGLEGIAQSLGLPWDVSDESRSVAAVREARGRFDTSIGCYVDRETGEPL